MASGGMKSRSLWDVGLQVRSMMLFVLLFLVWPQYSCGVGFSLAAESEADALVLGAVRAQVQAGLTRSQQRHRHLRDKQTHGGMAATERQAATQSRRADPPKDKDAGKEGKDGGSDKDAGKIDGIAKDAQDLLQAVAGKQIMETKVVSREEVEKQREAAADNIKKLRETAAKTASDLDELDLKHTKMSIDLDVHKGRLRALDAQVGLLATEASKAAHQNELVVLQKQYDDFTRKANTLYSQYIQLRGLRGAVYARMMRIHNELIPLQSKSDIQVRRALDIPAHTYLDMSVPTKGEVLNNVANLMEDHRSPMGAVARGLQGVHEFNPTYPYMGTQDALGTASVVPTVIPVPVVAVGPAPSTKSESKSEAPSAAPAATEKK